MKDQEIIQLIREGGHDRALDRLYENYPAFRSSFIKAGGRSGDAGDIFQDALFLLVRKVQAPEFTLTSKLNTYLYSLCRNLVHEYFRKLGKTSELPPPETEEETFGDHNLKYLEEERQYAALDRVLATIGKKCMELLSLFYLKRMSLSEVAVKMSLGSENSAKTRKYKCLEKARKMAGEMMAEINTL